jgi:predicted PurR-regulated permease PerM
MDQPSKQLTTFQINASVAAAGGLVLCAVFVLWRILPGILWALVLAIALWPSFLRVRRWRMSAAWRKIGAPSAFTVLIAILVAAPISFATIEIIKEGNLFISWVNAARQHGVALPAAISEIPWAGTNIAAWWQENLATPDSASDFFAGVGPRSLLGITRDLGPQIFHRALLFGIALLTLFFLFREGEELCAKALPIAEHAFGDRSKLIVSHVVDAIHGTVDGLVLVGLAEGLVIGIGYGVTGVPHPVAFAIATSIVAAIPFGAPLVFCVAALVLLGLGKVLAGIGLAVFGFLIVFVVDHIIRPVVIGEATRIPFLLVLLGILGGLSALGLVGLFVGPALMAVLTAVWRDLTTGAEGDVETASVALPHGNRDK